MTAEKVKYFTNTDVVAYLIVFFAIGASVGYAFGKQSFTNPRPIQEFEVQFDAKKIVQAKDRLLDH